MTGLVVLALLVAITYELALARVPQHRATLERVVQAQTGLDIRFNELNLHWGWYGPEAVFRNVELAEPGRSDVLIRAPQLIVGVDAWDSIRTGQLQPGRITFIAPDIDLSRSRAARTKDPRAVTVATSLPIRLLQGWAGGRIETEGGSLRLPSSQDRDDPVVLHIRRASLRRAADEWSVSALFFLPDRLGHSVRLSAQLAGDLTQPASLSGALRLDGLRLAFAGWHRLLTHRLPRKFGLPIAGEGNLTLRLNFIAGQLDKSEGELDAREVWVPGQTSDLKLQRLAGNWRLQRKQQVWQLRVTPLEFTTREAVVATTALSLVADRQQQHVRGSLDDMPLEALTEIISGFVPKLDLTTIQLAGMARDLRFDWDTRRARGARLQLGLNTEALQLAPRDAQFKLEGLAAQVAASETAIDISLQSKQAQLSFAGPELQPLTELRIDSELRLSREGEQWSLATPLLTLDHLDTQLILSGQMAIPTATPAGSYDIRATLLRADIPWLQQILGVERAGVLRALAEQISSGRIERLQIQVQRLNDASEAAIAGNMAVREVAIKAGEHWPAVSDIAARLEWTPERAKVQLEQGRVGVLKIESGEARWGDGLQDMQITARVRSRAEAIASWLQEQPQLLEYMPYFQDLPVQGDAVVALELAFPRAPRPRVRVVSFLEGAELAFARGIPALKSIRGSLAYDSERLQPSTFTGRWLGGPVTFRLDEARKTGEGGLTVRAQGLWNSSELLALSGMNNWPEFSGEIPWNGELQYSYIKPDAAARWEWTAYSSLIGLTSQLPPPLHKAPVTALPLRLNAQGNAENAEMTVAIGNRLRARLKLVPQKGGWRTERGALYLGAQLPALPADAVLSLRGEISQLDLSSYAPLWHRLAVVAPLAPLWLDVTATPLWLGERAFADVRLQGRTDTRPGTTQLRLESSSVAGRLRWPSDDVVDLQLTAMTLNETERLEWVARIQQGWQEARVTIN